jgi:hypothetical protein
MNEARLATQQLQGSTEPTTARVRRGAQTWTGADMSTWQ